ncbi:TPA: hypothetical protein N0F65_009317 [Lagenidium giganteum]|uniref:Uncharacterized protein n=1 Tax=Lagenidium giganteum TaxID=4803 RepID=A0AAV2YVA5_9STRA|nr:TPA: hypothetical protein N0F65_009317 [Lagenidium giganteum]
MKQRLQEDRQAVAIGSLQPRTTRKKAHKLPQLKDKVANHRVEVLAQADRPHSFENERQQVMETLALPSPTRSLVKKHVQHSKDEHVREQAELPPVAGAFKKRQASHSMFPRAYQRGELPIMIESKAGGKALRWTRDMRELDYTKYFPLFVEGMREHTYPFNFLARKGAFQLLQYGRQHPEKVIDCLHRVVPALRTTLEMRETKYIRDTLTILQELVKIDGVGPMLVPYYRQLLPVLNLFKSKRRNLGDDMDYQQDKVKDLGEMIRETLELLERTGGVDAYVNIKYMVPTYEGIRQT